MSIRPPQNELPISSELLHGFEMQYLSYGLERLVHLNPESAKLLNITSNFAASAWKIQMIPRTVLGILRAFESIAPGTLECYSGQVEEVDFSGLVRAGLDPDDTRCSFLAKLAKAQLLNYAKLLGLKPDPTTSSAFASLLQQANLSVLDGLIMSGVQYSALSQVIAELAPADTAGEMAALMVEPAAIWRRILLWRFLTLHHILTNVSPPVLKQEEGCKQIVVDDPTACAAYIRSLASENILHGLQSSVLSTSWHSKAHANALRALEELAEEASCMPSFSYTLSLSPAALATEAPSIHGETAYVEELYLMADSWHVLGNLEDKRSIRQFLRRWTPEGFTKH